MSEGPTWIITDPAKPYHDERFDGVTPPLDPQQPTPEDMERELHMLRSRVEGWKLRYEAANEVADAARDALDNIETVLMHWTFHFISDMSKLRALRDMLTPPAPKWTKDEDA